MWTILIFACGTQPAADPDRDHDGYAATDCAPDDPDVHPGAPDDDCDGVDADCDGAVDEASPTARLWYPDKDGDGWGNDLSPGPLVPGCTAPLGFGPAGDCDDQDGATHPDAPDVVCDGVDHDCDGDVNEDAPEAHGWYVDTDGDGYGNVETEVITCAGPAGTLADGTDCDDDDADRHPGGTLGCDGWYAADEIAWGSAGTGDLSDTSAATLRSGRDIDGDGRPDLLISSSYDTSLWLLTGAAEGHTDLTRGGLTGLVEFTTAATWAPDWDGDGVDEVLAPLVVGGDCLIALPAREGVAAGIACYDAGSAYAKLPADGHDPGAIAFWGARVVQPGSPGDDAGTQGTAITDPGAAEGSWLGVAWAGDVDGDGMEDLYAAIAADADAPDFGAVYLLLGPFDGARTTAEADAVVAGTRPWAVDPGQVRDAGDADGDGHPELLQGASGGNARFVDARSGQVPATVTDDASAFVVDYPNVAATDLDADGLADLVIPAPVASILTEADGALLVLRSPLAGTVDVDAADMVIRGDTTMQRFGTSWAGIGDWNDDGVPDLAATDHRYYGSGLDDGLRFFSLDE